MSRKSFSYISGRMSGMPGWNFKAFNRAEKDLRKKGYDVFNPATHGVDKWEKLLRRDVKIVMKAASVIVLDKWYLSKGAKLEVYVAKAFGIPVLSYPSLKEIPAEKLNQIFKNHV